MKGWILNKPGNIENLIWDEIAPPKVTENRLIIKVTCTALNPVDYQKIQSGNSNWIYPHYPGVDVAGEVIEVGSATTDNFAIGDRVVCHMDLNEKGAFAEFTSVDSFSTTKIPEGVSYEEAVAVLCSGMTAYNALYQKFNINQKKTILIHGGAGGVGGFAIQLAKELNLSVFTTASSKNHEWVKSLGADCAIDYMKENVTKRILKETNGEGVDLILNTVNSSEATEDLKRLAFSGQLAYIAGAPDLSTINPFTLSPSIHEIALGAAYTSNSLKAKKNLAFMANELMLLIKNNQLNPMINKVVSNENLPYALKELKKRHTRGKIIIKLP